MRELDGLDDIEIGIWVDTRASQSASERPVAMILLERKEGMRRALVSVDGEPVNVDGVPYAGMDRWSKRTMAYVATAFNELNGVEADELKKFVARAVDVSQNPSRPNNRDPSTAAQSAG